MFSFSKSNRIVNIIIDHYVIRMVETNGNDLSSIEMTSEKLLPAGTIENGKIVDDISFFNFMKEVVTHYNLKNRKIRFCVPDELIIMRDISIDEKVKLSELKEYITMEIGHTIHFPFNDPVFDIYDTSRFKNEAKVTIFAAPGEEILKYTELFADASLKPIAVDAKPLGLYRFFSLTHDLTSRGHVHLFYEFNLSSSNISVFNDYHIELLRFQSLNIPFSQWKYHEEDEEVVWTYQGEDLTFEQHIADELIELERIMDFYRFSMHQGERDVTHLVLLGDNPYLQVMKERMNNFFEQKIMTLTTTDLSGSDYDEKYIPALGLALKGGH